MYVPSQTGPETGIFFCINAPVIKLNEHVDHIKIKNYMEAFLAEFCKT